MLSSEKKFESADGRTVVHESSLIHFMDARGRTVIHESVLAKSAETLRVLLEYRPDLDVRDQADQTPLHLAVLNQQLEHAKVLIDAGADMDLSTNAISSPKEMAYFLGFFQRGTFLAIAREMVRARESSSDNFFPWLDNQKKI